jgi:hypothetical protein
MTRRHAATRSTRDRLLSVTAIVVLGVCLAMVTFALASLLLPGGDQLPERPTMMSILSFMAVFVSFPLVGAILASRRPTNPIGWLFLFTAFGMIVGIFATEYVGRIVYLGAPWPAGTFVAWLGQWTFSPGVICAVTLVPLLFPDGRVPGPMWRPVLWAAVVTVVASGMGAALRPGPFVGFTGEVPGMSNPFGLPGALGELAILLETAAFAAFGIVGIASMASMIVRFRRSRSVERAQLKWPLFAMVALLFTLGLAMVTELEALFSAAMLSAAAIPVAAGVAITRYRLYEIDRIISRGLSWAVLSALLLAVYAGGILVLQGVLGGVTQGETVGVAASTLLAAALFQPLRRRVQRAMDHRFDRARYDGERTAAAFGERLRNEVGMTGLEADISETIVAALRPSSTGVWIRGERS